ncbi:MAG: alanine racemase [Monoglobales bacterium]
MNINSRRTWAEVDLGAIENNIKNIKEYVGDNIKVLAVVKADAYGHGSVPVAKRLTENGADYLGVAFVGEAEELRSAGIDCPILLLGYTNAADVEKAVELGVTPTIFHFETAKRFSDAAIKAGKVVKIHVKIDTGMNRVGFECNDKSVEEIVKISKLENLEIEGIFTHFACADEALREYTDYQAENFLGFIGKLEKQGINILIKHACNSAGIIGFPEYHFDMVRAGIITYGIAPSEEVDISKLNLKPALTVKSTVSRVFDIAPGEKISYGGTFIAQKPMKAAVLPIGYADGYLRALSNKGIVLVNGQYAKVIGRICMDQCIIDVTNVNNINVEDEVIIAGGSHDCPVSFEALAKICDTISYELFCVIGKRVPRVYLG